MAIAPSAIVALNRAVAVAEVHGDEHALELVDALDLPKYYLYTRFGLIYCGGSVARLMPHPPIASQ